jgi:hypothetical protein
MSTREEQFLIVYFKELRNEMHLRIQNHNKLVATKVATCGALLSFLFIQFPESKLLDENIKLYGFILVPIIAMLYDVMIAKNVYSIHRIGLFIRDKIEEEHFPFMKLWEKYVGQRKKRRGIMVGLILHY